jgi:hypothetical protein
MNKKSAISGLLLISITWESLRAVEFGAAPNLHVHHEPYYYSGITNTITAGTSAVTVTSIEIIPTTKV